MNDAFDIKKYPRTPHIEGSRIQPGDEDMSQIPFAQMAGRYAVVEEKIDGANSAVSFDADGRLLLQSRGHYLRGGYRERHFNFMKQWAQAHAAQFYKVLGSRYIMYGEWMYAKHSIFYDALPSYFMEFDILDRETGRFLDTRLRREMTARMPVCSVPVLAEGKFAGKDELIRLLGPSRYITREHTAKLRAYAEANGLDPDRQCRETDPSNLMEGLYIKIEEDGQVLGRMKFVRQSFLQCVEESQTHWLDRPIVPNQLAGQIEDLLA